MRNPAELITGLYEAHAAAWDASRTRSLVETAWLDRFLDLMPQKPGSILDIGCGAAEPMARYFIEKGQHVTGVDTAPSLLALSKKRFPDQEWLVSDMRTMALGKRFDGLLAWNSFFHLTPDDQRGMFPIFHSHAAENAVLMFTSGTSLGEAIGSFQGQPLYHGSLDRAEYRTLLDDNGFDVMAHVVEDPTCGHLTIWLARLRARSDQMESFDR